jgi:Flp pilus assembly protein CpaB
VRRHRRTLGAVLVAAAVLVLAGQLRPPPPPTVPVVVAARDLAASTVLTADDVTVVRVPPEAAAPTALPQPDAVVGEVLAAPVAAGEALSSVRLRGASLLTGQPEGSVALPVRLSDAGAAVLLSPGDHIDLVAARTDGESSRGVTVAEHLPVLLVPGGAVPATGVDALTSGAGAGSAADAGGGLVVVAALPAQARDVVAASADGPLWFTLDP